MKVVNATAYIDDLVVFHSEGETEWDAEKSAWESINRCLNLRGSSVWPVSIKIEIDDKIVVDCEASYNFDIRKWEM